MRERLDQSMTAPVCLQLGPTVPRQNSPTTDSDILSHIFATCPQHFMIHHWHPGMSGDGQLNRCNRCYSYVFCSKSVHCSLLYVCVYKNLDFFYKYLVGHHCIGRMLTDNIELFKCVPISSSWPSSQKSSEAGSGPDLQVSKWPWVMGLDDYTCSPMITVITLHRHSALLYTWVLWLQAC